ncbi:MAG: glycoside hydrolase family 2 protein, partial [Armatimonadetes bacterium]|nr:glycoside hydrolase family 2 protein [Anaerolineae bacterium]
MRQVFAFNHDWLFYAQPAAEALPDSAFAAVTLPHTNQVFPHHNFDDAEYQFVSTYRKRFTLPAARDSRRIYLDFEGAMTAATVSINGHTFAEHQGGYVPFSFDITDYLVENGENLLTVQLDSTERQDIPPHGHTVDYMVFGGIYREVALRYIEPCHIVNVFVKPQVETIITRDDGSTYSDDVAVDCEVTVHNQSDAPVDLALTAYLTNTVNFAERVAVTLAAGTTQTYTVHLTAAQIGGIVCWSLTHPMLHSVTVQLEQGSTMVDVQTAMFGVRQVQFRDDGFYLNGARVQLIGLNRHQNYPYIGAAAPARLQRKDADIIKYELGCTVVRTSHYPQSRHFLDRCDEIGLLVFEEIPGWQHIGDDAWKALALRDVRAMIERDWNHPSIILWGVRINESWDDHDFYTQTNALARQLDPTRQTGGVRFFLGSDFLEDVYTLNDFSNGIMEPEHTPHLVTEFNGHMFPTKSFDAEQRRVEHALRHTRVQSQAYLMGGVAGAIGWCAFDYNTHMEFGAGDRICYHGVMDIFRLPKFAAWFYASQQSPTQRVILHAATGWQLGDVNEGMIEPVLVFSNCDAIEVYIGDAQQGRFTPDAQNFPGLPHPPFQVRNLEARLAQPYGDLRIVGYVDGQPVAEQRIAADALPRALMLTVDDAQLNADGMDMTRVVFAVVDSYGNPLPYATTVVTLSIEGESEAELIGENPFPLVGGAAAVY